MARNTGYSFIIIIIFALSLSVLLIDTINIWDFTRSGIVYGLDLEGRCAAGLSGRPVDSGSWE